MLLVVAPNVDQGMDSRLSCLRMVTICDYPAESVLPRMSAFIQGLYAQRLGLKISTRYSMTHHHQH